MATIRKRVLPSGATAWQADYKDGEGKRRHKQFDKRSEADAFLLTVRGEVRAGTHVAESRSITFAEAAKSWLTKVDKELERSTAERYRATYDSHVQPAFGERKLSTITPPQIQTHIDGLANLSASSIKKVRDCIRQVFSHAVKRGRAGHNPATEIDLPARPRGKQKPEMPTKNEMRLILKHTPPKWVPYIRTAILTGMRASEMRGLQWDAVDLDKGVIHVVTRTDRYGKFGPPKSDAGMRDLPLSSGTVDMLEAWKAECPKSEHNLVFPAPEGGFIAHPNILRRVFWPLQVKAGVVVDSGKVDDKGEAIMEAKYSLHALRHAAAALFIEQGLPPKKVQYLMGHASIHITYDVYGYLFPKEDDDRAAMGAIDTGLFD